MQVNNVQQSPNFGMALRIKPEALETLKKATRSEIEQLQKIGEELKDTKFYHLEIGENGKRTITSPYANKYSGGSFNVQNPPDEFLKFDARWAGTESGNLKKGDIYRSSIRFENAEAAKEAYRDMCSAGWGIEKDVKMVKYLDKAAIERDEAEKATQAERKAVEAMVDNLFDSYGVKQ